MAPVVKRRSMKPPHGGNVRDARPEQSPASRRTA